jgi:hypothetical protein
MGFDSKVAKADGAERRPYTLRECHALAESSKRGMSFVIPFGYVLGAGDLRRVISKNLRHAWPSRDISPISNHSPFSLRAMV